LVPGPFFEGRDLKNVKKHGIKQFFVKLFRPLLRYLEKTDENKAIIDKLTHDDSQSKLSQEQLSELQRSTHFDKKELQQWYKGG
jgi:hypothetical protein